jgi:predicted nucleic acid-binding protein
LLEGDLGAKASTQGIGRPVISALTATETMRAIVRARFVERISAQRYRNVLRNLSRFLKKCFVAEVNESVLERAGRPFPIEPVRTLDAIHLATLENLGASPAQVIVVTRDHRVRDNAIALGYQVE